MSHKSSVGVFSNQTADIGLPDFETTSNRTNSPKTNDETNRTRKHAEPEKNSSTIPLRRPRKLKWGGQIYDLLLSLQLHWIVCLFQSVQQPWHHELCHCHHQFHGGAKECLDLPSPQYLEQVPSVLCHPHEPTIMGLQDLPNKKSTLRLTRHLPPLAYLMHPPSLNDKSAWGEDTKWTGQKNVLWHTLSDQYDCCPPTWFPREDSLWTSQPTSPTNADSMLQ